MVSIFKAKNVQPVMKARPIMSGVMGLFIILQLYQLSSLAITDGKKHIGYVLIKAAISIVGIFIWLQGLKSGKFGQTVLTYIGFLVLAGIVQLFSFFASYGETVKTVQK